MRLTHALLASDSNPRYLDFWPLARRAWSDVVGIEPVLVLVAEPAQVPAALRLDPLVHVFPPVPSIHTAFQAQCIRLLYPALLEAEGAVVVSDADMVPLSSRYFRRAVSRVDEEHFVAFRDAHLSSGEIPICYNAALPRTWGGIFGVKALENVRTRLAEWGAEVEYEGVRAGRGWLTDQRILYRSLVDHGRRTRTVWILDDHYTGFRRLERDVVQKRGGLDEAERRRISHGVYADFHCAQPYSDFRSLNESAVDAAADSRAD